MAATVREAILELIARCSRRRTRKPRPARSWRPATSRGSPRRGWSGQWLEERARLIGSLIGLTDEPFNRETAPGQWTYR
jgi:hypothetical protein